MKAAVDRGDLPEAARQGALAGPAIVEKALAAPDRATRLAGIAAAPLTEDRAELLPALARAAAGPDRRTAIPAAHAAVTIARELMRRPRPDDLADDDLATWRADFGHLALAADRWIEVRVAALETSAALGGFDVAAALGDPDPAFRRAAAGLVAIPAPAGDVAALAAAVVKDGDPDVALAAAQALCASLDPSPKPALAALGAPGLTRIRTLVTAEHAEPTAVRDAAQCLAADGTPESAAVLKSLRRR